MNSLSILLRRTLFIRKTSQDICTTYIGCQRCNSSQANHEKPHHGDTPMSENDVVNPEFINRNVRSLEIMGLARKRKGWNFQYPPVMFYYRLWYNLSSRHISALVETSNGEIILSASTKEYSIAKHLYSFTDVCASKNIGRVLAKRCLQSGISNMNLMPPDTIGDDSLKFQAFLSAIEEGGIEFNEPTECVATYTPGLDYDNDKEMKNLEERQRKVADVSEEHRLIKKARKRWNRPFSKWETPSSPFRTDNTNHRIHPFNEQ